MLSTKIALPKFDLKVALLLAYFERVNRKKLTWVRWKDK